MVKVNPEAKMPESPFQQRAISDLSYAFVMCELAFSNRSSDKIYEKARLAVETALNDYFNVCCLVTNVK